MHSGPLARDHAREQAQLQVHERADHGVQLQPAVRFTPMQEDRGAKDGYLQDYQRDDQHPQQTHSPSK
jgi:hypothetical protein